MQKLVSFWKTFFSERGVRRPIDHYPPVYGISNDYKRRSNTRGRLTNFKDNASYSKLSLTRKELGMPKSRDLFNLLLPGFSGNPNPGIFWSRDIWGPMIPGFEIPGYYPYNIGIFRDIPGFFHFNVNNFFLVHITFFYLNSENFYYSAS